MPEPCENLIIHCHGGGFVSQSSSSHESYLRDWAVRLDIPIVSVDYSLAPRAPYPRAREELLFAYVWALSNAAYLGTTAKRVIMAGNNELLSNNSETYLKKKFLTRCLLLNFSNKLSTFI